MIATEFQRLYVFFGIKQLDWTNLNTAQKCIWSIAYLSLFAWYCNEITTAILRHLYGTNRNVLWLPYWTEKLHTNSNSSSRYRGSPRFLCYTNRTSVWGLNTSVLETISEMSPNLGREPVTSITLQTSALYPLGYRESSYRLNDVGMWIAVGIS